MITRVAPVPTWFDRVAADWSSAPPRTPAAPWPPRRRPAHRGTASSCASSCPALPSEDIDIAVDGRVLTVTAARADDGQRWSAVRKVTIGEGYDLDQVRAHYATAS